MFTSEAIGESCHLPLKNSACHHHTFMHAAQCPAEISRKSGTPPSLSANGPRTPLHASTAIGQRVWNTQPAGGVNGLGMSPRSTILSRWRSILGFGSGTADKRACVYGWSGLLYNSSGSPTSTILPKYITITLSLMWRTTDKSWALTHITRRAYLHRNETSTSLSAHIRIEIRSGGRFSLLCSAATVLVSVLSDRRLQPTLLKPNRKQTFRSQ